LWIPLCEIGAVNFPNTME